MSSSRETVESFVMVFLFFLVMSLQAEGFVIPTGSMAPTLMGRHKEITCPECENVYAVNADREVGNEIGTTYIPGSPIVGGTCDNCRFPARVDSEPSFSGDRIYVMKTPLWIPYVTELDTARLSRWNVGVFKLPEGPEIRYIKRLIGLPGEVVRILRGDIWVRPLDNSQPFRRSLRPLAHQDAMQVLVYDDNHRARSLKADPRWTRWVSRGEGSWNEAKPAQYTITPATSKDWTALQYRNMVPDPVQWAALSQNQPLPHDPRPTLITDFYAYNTDLSLDALNNPSQAAKTWRQPHWVGDLMLRFTLQVKEPKGRLRVGLVKAGVTYGCEFDVSTGVFRFGKGEEPLGRGGLCPIKGVGTYEIAFANVDDRLSLRVNGEAIGGDGRILFPTDHGPDDASEEGKKLEALAPRAADLEPAVVAAKDASVVVSNLRLTRDIYYTLDPSHADLASLDLSDNMLADPVSLFDWLGDPSKFVAFGKLPPRDFPITPGHYMMMGDNSPWSADGRAWGNSDQVDPERPGRGWDNSGRQRWEVPESLVIGKAFCVYWPHLKPFGPTLKFGRDFRLPVRPYFEKMRFIH